MVSRYAFDGVEEYNPQGDWVSVSDYDALAAENQALRERAESAERAEAAAWNDAIEAAKAWHRFEIARLQNQVSENNAYLTRVGASSQDTEANRYCLGLISAHQKSIAAIRALRRAAPTEDLT